jgi:hypothetical protein
VSQPPRSSVALELEVSPPATSSPSLLLPASAPPVEFDTVLAAGGKLSVLPRVQRIRMGPARGGQHAHVWADKNSVHIIIDGELVKTAPSNLNAGASRSAREPNVRSTSTPSSYSSVSAPMNGLRRGALFPIGRLAGGGEYVLCDEPDEVHVVLEALASGPNGCRGSVLVWLSLLCTIRQRRS